jgi:hypothetical protein
MGNGGSRWPPLRVDVSVTCTFQFPDRTQCQWNIEHHHFQAQHEESLETIDDDLVVIRESLDDPLRS